MTVISGWQAVPAPRPDRPARSIGVAPRDMPAPGLPPGGPTYEGFQIFASNVFQLGITDPLPPDQPSDTWLQICYDQAANLAYWGLATIPSQPNSPSIYAFAVYNLGCAFMVEMAQDDPTTDPPQTYWTDLRNTLGINSATYGMINSAADQGTSESMYIPDVIKGMTLLDLQLMKSPWGRAYLMLAGEWGSIWGLTI